MSKIDILAPNTVNSYYFCSCSLEGVILHLSALVGV